MKTPLQDVAARTALAEQIIALLGRDTRVASVEIGGSLRSGGPADQYSDIDLGVRLQPDVCDRRFAEDIPTLIAAIGPLLAEGWGVRMLPNKYVRTLYFADYPLFWHVDLGCGGGEHVDGSDLLESYHWPRFFKTWLETLKSVLRGRDKDTPECVETMLGRWLDLPPGDPAMSPRLRLAACLDICAERTRAERTKLEHSGITTLIPSEAAVDAFYLRCDELRREHLTVRD